MLCKVRYSIESMFYNRFFAKYIDLAGIGPIVTFTFDDFPTSALFNGGRILEKHGAKGTFYLAPGLCGMSTEVGAIISRDNINKCYEAGHEIGHHTYSHLDCSVASKNDIMADILKADMDFGDINTENFSFPYGRCNKISKIILRKRFKSCRGIHSGINSGVTDVLCLKSNAIYSKNNNLTSLKDMIIDAKNNGGWLIFYTHDVAKSPSPYGCTEQEFEYLVHAAIENDICIATVNDVVSKYL